MSGNVLLQRTNRTAWITIDRPEAKNALTHRMPTSLTDTVTSLANDTTADVSLQHFAAAREMGMETVGFLMLSHRIGPDELAGQARIMVDGGAQCVYVVDSAGALALGDAQARISALIGEIGQQAQVGFHGHQNLSLGIANSVLAVQNGAVQIDGALCALGAGAGNSRSQIPVAANIITLSVLGLSAPERPE
jgi:4-hydroxy-2-oxovalerate aldolase